MEERRQGRGTERFREREGEGRGGRVLEEKKSRERGGGVRGRKEFFLGREAPGVQEFTGFCKDCSFFVFF